MHAYQSFVLGLVFGVAGAAGLFLSDQSGVRIAALIGVALGFVVAPYQAFQRMRRERDAARSDIQLNRLAINAGYVNLLSGGNWGIDSFEPPNLPGLIARAITGVPYALARDAEFASKDMDRFRDLVASSPLADWLERTFPCEGPSESEAWQLVSPCNGFEFTVARQPVVVRGGGSEASARCMITLPRGIYGVFPRLMVDLVFRDLPKEPPEDGRQPDPYTRFELAGEPYRPTLAELVEILGTLTETLTEIAPAVLKPIVHRTLREGLSERVLRRRLPLIGPNYHVRSKPRYLREALKLPDFPRLGGGYDEIELMVQMPPRISAYDRNGRLVLFRRGIRQLLRSQQFRDFESFVDALGTTSVSAEIAREHEPAAAPPG
jgi:hypothetical protein